MEYEHTEVIGNSLMAHITVQFPVLKSIDKCLTVHVINTSSATTTGAVSNIKVSGTVVGFTLENLGISTTLSCNLACVGF